MNENWCVTSLDAVVRVEYRRVNDRSESLAGGVCRIGCDERVNEDLIPLQHLVGILSKSFASRRGGRSLDLTGAVSWKQMNSPVNNRIERMVRDSRFIKYFVLIVFYTSFPLLLS